MSDSISDAGIKPAGPEIFGHSEPRENRPQVLRRQAASRVTRLEAQIRDALAAGDRGRARALQGKLLRSFSGRYLAAWEGNMALRVERRSAADEQAPLAARLCASRGTREPVRMVAKTKRDGSSRSTLSFGLENRALQYLAVRALQPFAQLHPGQYLLNGGRKAACAAVREAMRDGYKWVYKLDVADCFSSFDQERVADCLPLPSDVTRAVITPGVRLNVVHTGRNPEAINLVRRSRRGIPQGSAASSLVAEMLLAVGLPELPEGVRLISLADDFLILTRTKREAVAGFMTLRAAFAQHPAGSLRFGRISLRRVADGFDFLGYRFRTRYRRLIVEPTCRNMSVYSIIYRVLLRRARTREDYEELRVYTRSWCAGFDLWEDMALFREFRLRQLDCAAARAGLLERPLSPIWTVGGAATPEEARRAAVVAAMRRATPPSNDARMSG